MATALCLVGEATVRLGAVPHNAAMNDVLAYLQNQLASFDEVPFNAVDSALLAQFCMVRGEGIMPQVYGADPEEAPSRKTTAGRGPLAELRGLIGRLRRRAGEHADEGIAGARIEESEASPANPSATAAKATAAKEAAGPSSAAARDRAEVVQDAKAPVAPVRFVDLMRAELFPAMFSGMHAAQMKQQLFWMAASPRFRDVLIYDHAAAFDEVRDLQFAATTYVCPGRFAYVGFRGTDTTLTGWREDFNMAYQAPVEAQALAARYLAAVAADPRLPETLMVGGHSKGGNLAEYAALAAAPEVQGRIAHLYNHDGPGFKAGLFTATDYAPLAGRMTKQVPADSMVGILMESFMPVEVVQATGRGFEQHSVFRWVVEGADGAPGPRDAERARDAGEVRDADGMREAPRAFATLPELPERTQRRAEALDRWLASLDGSEREAMVNALFAALKAAGITDASQLFEGGREWAILRDGVMGAPAEDRTIMLNALRGLTRAFSDVTAERNSARRAEQRRAKGA
ncbi:Mbeg1-like protein [uncultured Adlercreutzia sp.]|uniref:Mbeg1-like protein n=1 Tax=uncultured Adlercreutzia sp. TaxID=875803 RepID=UPI00258F642C|nr:Mbeg1-like protein [uncultured Adlercreutzia sp.]